MTRPLQFSKMVAAGNDFVVLNGALPGLATLRKAGLVRLVRQLCDRRRGVGADGVLLLTPETPRVLHMRILNADGSEAEMCGNGARCAALWGFRTGRLRSGDLLLKTMAGPVTARRIDERTVSVQLSGPAPSNGASTEGAYSVTIGDPATLSVNGRRIDLLSVNSGVPHAIIFTDRLDDEAVEPVGRDIRWHEHFAPSGTNVDFVQRIGPRAIRQRTYERGVEGETLACGTGAVASAVASVWTQGKTSGRHVVSVTTRGGDRLQVKFALQQKQVYSVELTGEARLVYEGSVNDV